MMKMNRFGRLPLIVAVLIAFASGLVFASGFDLTRISWAQAKTVAPPKPTSQEVRSLEETGQAFEAIAEHVRPAVVSIEAEQLESRRSTPQRRNVPPGFEEFFRNFEMPDQPRSGSGSGFIVSKDGYILTNNHVVAGADRVTVTLFDNRRFEAKVVGRDPTTDVAVLKIDGSNLPTVNLGDDAAARVGQWVVAIGNPLNLDFTVTAGIVSAKGRSQLQLPGRERYAIQDFIQTDAAINPGNSGGPLVNIRGEVIGINSAIASATGFNAGYGFAIPITLAKLVMNDIVEHGRVRRGVLGVTINDAEPADARVAGLSEIFGAKIGGFDPSEAESPAARAGLQPGDVIIGAASQRVNRVSELQRIIRAFKPGDVVDVDVMRYGERKTFRVRLGEPPRPEEEQVASAPRSRAEPVSANTRTYGRLGISVQPVPADFIEARAVPSSYRNGLLVTDVSNRGPAYRGLNANRDIILRTLHPSRRDIRSVNDLEQALGSVKRGEIISLLVFDTAARNTRVVNVSLND